MTRWLVDLVDSLGFERPAEFDDAKDPFDVLRYASSVDVDLADKVSNAFRDLEIEAVRSAPMTEGIVHILESLANRGNTVTIVSNNSEAAVRAFVSAHNLNHLLAGIVGRASSDAQLLKPNPSPLTVAA